jgi:hypothetical protein
VYIGRQRPAFMWSGGYHLPRSIWSNPFKVGSREEVIGNYERWLLTERPDLVARLPELRGKGLACWCAPPGGLTASDPLRCHGQMLARIADEA